jgi:hypothetical protein
MKNLKILFTPLTSFSEMFTADQLWGQMVWAISDLHGDGAAEEFVMSFKDNPPFLISDFTIHGYLPVPVLSDTKQRKASDLAIAKQNKKNRWISIQDFAIVQKNSEQFFERPIEDSGFCILKSVSEVHPTISRETGTVIDGGLFNSSYLYSEKDLCVYVRFLNEDSSWEKTVLEIIDYWKVVGLGGDRNVGHGQFEIRVSSLSAEENDVLSFCTGNAVMSISTCFGENLVPVSYKLKVYTGIVGKGDNCQGIYRKNPIIEFFPGSVFAKGNGIIAQGVHPDERICSFGLVFPLTINVKG